jgi:uncharacterized membrane protein YvbJ
MKCPVCGIYQEMKDSPACSQCGSSLLIHQKLNNLREMTMSKLNTENLNPEVFISNKDMVKFLKQIVSVVLLAFLLTTGVLVYYMRKSTYENEQLIVKLSNIQTDIISQKLNSDKNVQVKPETFEMLVSALQVSTETLRDELVDKRKKELPMKQQISAKEVPN